MDAKKDFSDDVANELEAECARLMPAKWTFKRVEIPPDHPYEKPVMIEGSN